MLFCGNPYDALLSESGRKQAAGLLAGLREAEVDALTSLLSKALHRDSKNAEAYNAFLKVAETIPVHDEPIRHAH